MLRNRLISFGHLFHICVRIFQKKINFQSVLAGSFLFGAYLFSCYSYKLIHFSIIKYIPLLLFECGGEKNKRSWYFVSYE
ncbi:hypothetical protein EH319_08315 [Enterococcus faecium]|nr:hypothetical protein [Enterococcus faecium]